jgi:hypothetical protein
MITLLCHLLFIVASINFPICLNAKTELDSLPIITTDYQLAKTTTKEWTFIVYIAADNDLRRFAGTNIRQMAAIGSNHNINILVHLDIRITPQNKTTRRYYIDKEQVIYVNENDPNTASMDSGDPQTLISACKWGIENFPAKNYALVLWNHGTGALNPDIRHIVHPHELFSYNPTTHKMELDRSISFFDFINAQATNRGICWDYSTGNYLDDQKVDYALSYVQKNYLNGAKFDLIAFDACLMGMIEVTNLYKPYAKYIVAAQEVVLGTGFPYDLMLAPFEKNCPDAPTLAALMVQAFKQKYTNITNDFTLSAIDLEKTGALENTIDTTASLLCKCIAAQSDNSVKNALAIARQKNLVTHFHEPSYVDLHHILANMYAHTQDFQFKNPEHEPLKNELRSALENGMQLIHSCVLANATGKNLSAAQGISIYFPENRLHSSYAKSGFAQSNHWFNFIQQFLG